MASPFWFTRPKTSGLNLPPCFLTPYILILISKYSPLLLLKVVTLHEVPQNVQLVNTELLLHRESRQVPVSLWPHFCQWFNMCLVLGVFPLKGTLFNAFCWFVNTELMANSRNLGPKWSVSDTRTAARPYHSLFTLGHASQHLGFMLGGHFKQHSHQQKAQRWKVWH